MSPSENSGHLEPSSTILVTGAAGGLGVHVADVLAEAGWNVRAFDRLSLEAQHRESLMDSDRSVEWVGPHDRRLEPSRLLDGCDAVVHTAGVASLSTDETELFTSNRDLSRRLFLAACDSGVEHFVHVSCASVYQADTAVRTEESPTRAYNSFEQSKLAAERVLKTLEDTREDAPALTILRMGLLYGPGCTSMGAGVVTLPAILRGFSRYLPGLSGGPRTNWCHVRDAARATDLVLRTPEARGETFNVADETALSFGEVLTSIIEGYDIDLGPSVRIPTLALWALLSPLLDHEWTFQKARGLLRRLWRGVQREYDLDSPLTPRLDRDALFYVRDDAIVVADKLRSLGWEPEWPDYREGIVETIRWYQRHGWAPRYEREVVADRFESRPSAHLDYDELLEGAVHTDDGDEPLRLPLELSWPSVPWPPSGGEGLLQGEVTFGDVAHAAPVRGTVTVRWFPVLQLEYDFGFRDADDNAYRFRGTRTFRTDSPIDSLCQLQGTFVDRYGEPIGEARARCTNGPLASSGSASQT